MRTCAIGELIVFVAALWERMVDVWGSESGSDNGGEKMSLLRSCVCVYVRMCMCLCVYMHMCLCVFVFSGMQR